VDFSGFDSDSDLAGRAGEGEVEREGKDGRGVRYGDEVELDRKGDLLGLAEDVAGAWAGRVRDSESVWDLLELSGFVAWMVDRTPRDTGVIVCWSLMLRLSFPLNGDGEASLELFFAKSCQGFLGRAAVLGNGDSSR
jgi:hypothetical protein